MAGALVGMALEGTPPLAHEGASGADAAQGAVPLALRLLVAVLTLRQLIIHAPAALYPHAAASLELWRPLTFAAAQVRFAATDALYALLVLVAPRATRLVQQVVCHSCWA